MLPVRVSRDQFNPIATNVPGIQISEHLAQACRRVQTSLRSCGASATHWQLTGLGREYVNTGSKPIPALEYPSYGAVVSKEQPSPKPTFLAWCRYPSAPDTAPDSWVSATLR